MKIIIDIEYDGDAPVVNISGDATPNQKHFAAAVATISAQAKAKDDGCDCDHCSIGRKLLRTTLTATNIFYKPVDMGPINHKGETVQ